MKHLLRHHRAEAMAAVAAITMVAMAPQAEAQPEPIPGGYSYALNLNIGSNPPPAGTPAWLTTNITDNLSGGVFVDLIGNLQGAYEFIESVGFNLTKKVTANNGNLPGSLWSCSSSTIGCGSTKIEQQFDNLPKVNFANGAQGFDLAIHLPTSSSQNRFQGSDTARFSISGLSPDDFLATNDPGSPVTGLWTAARVQGLGDKGKGSTTIADPPLSDAPGPLPLLGVGAALGFSRRLRQRLHHSAA
jgi:hypothetical protein